nr:hypothetical protein [uncultured Flavobacterium sp.]
METNQNSINLKTDRIFSSLKRVARIVLTTSSILLLISIISLLVYRGECFSVNSNAGFIIWPAVIASIYSIAYSLLTIITFLIYKTFKRHLIWSTIKTEILFLILTGLVMAIFYFVNAYTVENY